MPRWNERRDYFIMERCEALSEVSEGEFEDAVTVWCAEGCCVYSACVVSNSEEDVGKEERTQFDQGRQVS